MKIKRTITSVLAGVVLAGGGATMASAADNGTDIVTWPWPNSVTTTNDGGTHGTDIVTWPWPK